MSKTDRLYCTHCTFGTSALESHSADNAEKVLGYSVRASSVDDADRGRLRQLFRTVERLLSYELPRDTPAGKKESLDAATAPRRLTFMPNVGGCQIVGQISYRSRDTAGRPGSYFADILVGEVGRPTAGRAGQRSQSTEGRWSPTECLRLWSADHEGNSQGDWWCDSEERLAEQAAEGRGVPVAPSGRLGDVRDGGAECISDAAFWSLLNTPSGGDFGDHGRIIPPRWQNMPVDDRQRLVANLLQATIDLLKNRRRGNVVLAVEPSVAAVLFYGVCRLLPESLIIYSDQAAGISFSTYEPFPERPMTNLVATTFFDIENPSNDLPAEVYQRGFACNTFRQPFKCLKDGRELPRNDSYVQHILRLATDGHVPARDHADEHELLLTLNGLSNLNVTMLDQLVELDRSLAEYACGVRPWAEVSRTTKLPTAGAEAEFLRKRFRTMVGGGARQGQAEWPPDLLQRAIEWLGDELVAEDGLWGGGHPESYRVLAGMLPTTEAALKEFISSKSGRQPPDPVVIEAVVRVAHNSLKLPDCLGKFLAEREEAGRTKGMPSFFLAIVERLDKNQLPEILLNSNPEIHADRILSAITRGGCGLPKPIVAGFFEKLLGKVLDDGVATATRWRLLATHSSGINLLDQPIKSELRDRLSRHFSGTSPQSGLRNEPPPVTSSDGLHSLDFWAGLTTQPTENELLLRSWRDFYKGFNKLKEKIKASQGKGFAWGGASKAILEDVAVVAGSLCKIKGFGLSAGMENHHAEQCIGLFCSVLKAKETGVTDEESKQLDDLMQQHLNAQLAAREKSKSRSNAAANGKPKVFGRWAMLAAGIAILCAVAAGTYVALHGVSFLPNLGDDKVASGKSQGKDALKSQTPPPNPDSVQGEGSSEKAAETVQPPGRAKDLQPDESPTVSAEDIKLSLEKIKDGKLIVKWDPEVAKKGNCELTGGLRKPNNQSKDFTLSINPEKPPFQISLYDYGYGTYSLVFKVTPTKPGTSVIEKRLEVPFPRPKPPAVESLQLVIRPDTNNPELISRIKTDDGVSLYGKPSYTLRAYCGSDKWDGEVKPMPTASQEIHFDIPEKLMPDHFFAGEPPLTFRVLMSPLGAKPEESSEESPPVKAKFDVGANIANFMKRQIDEKTALNAKGICPLKSKSGANDMASVFLVRLPSLLQDKETELILLTPKWPKAAGAHRTLKLVRKEVAPNKSEWQVWEEPAEGNKAHVSPPATQQPLPCGKFYIERKNGWQPELCFQQTGTDKPTEDAAVRLSYCKLGVVYTPQEGVPQLVGLLQLLEPIAHKDGGTMQVKYENINYLKSIAHTMSIQKLKSHPKIDFRPPPPDTSGTVTAACDGKLVSLSVGDKVLATAEFDVSPEEGKLLLKQFKWAESNPLYSPEFGSLPFKKNDVLSLAIEQKINLATIETEFKHIRCGVKESATRGDYCDKLGLKRPSSPGQRLLSPEEWLKDVLAVRVDDKASDEYKKYVRSCVERSQKLVERYKEFYAFVAGIQDKTFKFAPWSIEWPVDFPAGTKFKSEDEYESIGGLVVKAIVCSGSDKTAEPTPAPR